MMSTSPRRRDGLVPSKATELITGGFLGDGLTTDLRPLTSDLWPWGVAGGKRVPRGFPGFLLREGE